MNFMNKLERKFGRYGIPNLSLYLIVCYVIGFVFSYFQPAVLSYLTLEPYYILQGQIWRIVSWVLVPPESLSLFTVIMLFFYYSLGTTLENTWGSFRYTLYILTGIIATVLGAFILYFVLGGGKLFGGSLFSTYYINMSIFLAFAVAYPEMRVMLYFIIPIKVKWMGILYAVFIAFSFFQNPWPGKVAIIASLANFFIFLFGNRNFRRITPKEIKRRNKFKQETKKATGVTKHKCAVCGRTEKDSDTLEFRFCSKCDGNYEYCQDHLFTHEHVHRHK